MDIPKGLCDGGNSSVKIPSSQTVDCIKLTKLASIGGEHPGTSDFLDPSQTLTRRLLTGNSGCYIRSNDSSLQAPCLAYLCFL